MRHRAALLAALLTPLAAAACGPAAHIDTPAGFATLEDQTEYIYRSSTAGGVVVAIRREENQPRGNLDFWADAIDRKLQNNRYVPEGKPSEARAASGQEGRMLRYTREDQGRVYRFWAVVFVTEGEVFLVEAGGDKERFTGKTEDAVAQALRSFSIH
jgi:hypothetical protein